MSGADAAAHEEKPQLSHQNPQLMRKSCISGQNQAMAEHTRRVLLHLGPGLRQAIDPSDIFFVEAVDDDTHVRTRRAERLVDVRTLGELEPILRRWGFVRVHRNHIVNPERVRQVRRRRTGDDWELKLDPPVNRVLPIGRSALSSLWKAFGEE